MRRRCREDKGMIRLRQAFADDKTSPDPSVPAVVHRFSHVHSLCHIRSSFTLSIHFFGCIPLLLVPSTCPYSATTGSLFPSILHTKLEVYFMVRIGLLWLVRQVDGLSYTI